MSRRCIAWVIIAAHVAAALLVLAVTSTTADAQEATLPPDDVPPAAGRAAAPMVGTAPGAALDRRVEHRCCYQRPEDIPRSADGSIKRSSSLLDHFRRLYSCPEPAADGTCPYSINHTVPLSVGGCDAIHNLTWIANAFKSCAEPRCTDRWERRVYAPACFRPP